MKRHISSVLLIWISTAFAAAAGAQEAKKDLSIFESSLHYTARGMAYWYDKAAGGLETITGIPYSQLMCQNCHVAACDGCHRTEKDNVLSYTTGVARKQETCLKCHGREASILNIDKQAGQIDVHSANGMECMSCHSAREMHGNGKAYASMRQPGAMDTRCATCHGSISQTLSHTVHGGKVDCKACHERHVVSCTNCHFETVLKENKRISIPVSGWIFLMNYEGEVTSATMQTFVVSGPKTFLMFAPQHSHSIMRKGRACGECHASEIVRQVRKGEVNLMWLEKGEVKQTKGVIPVADGVRWNIVYQDNQKGKWVPIEDAPAPGLHYASFGTPLSKEQIDDLAKPQQER